MVFYVASSNFVRLSVAPGFMKGILPKYFSSEWSFAQFRLPANKEDGKHVVAFASTPNTFYVVCGDGSLYVCSFDAEVRYMHRFSVCLVSNASA